MDRVSTPVAIALGSNLGDRRGHLAWAADALGAFIDELRLSSIHETDPVGVSEPQPPFLNAAAVGHTVLDPLDLLDRLQDLERLRGRERPYKWAPRTLDLDLVFFGTAEFEMDRLTVPHPRFRERLFVLGPLAEVAPDWVDPVTGKSVAALFDELRTREG